MVKYLARWFWGWGCFIDMSNRDRVEYNLFKPQTGIDKYYSWKGAFIAVTIVSVRCDIVRLFKLRYSVSVPHTKWLWIKWNKHFAFHIWASEWIWLLQTTSLLEFLWGNLSLQSNYSGAKSFHLSVVMEKITSQASSKRFVEPGRAVYPPAQSRIVYDVIDTHISVLRFLPGAESKTPKPQPHINNLNSSDEFVWNKSSH